MGSQIGFRQALDFIFNDHLLRLPIIVLTTVASLYIHFVGSPDIERNNITLRIGCVLMSQLSLVLAMRVTYRLCRLLPDRKRAAIVFLALLPFIGALRGFVLEHYLYDFNLVSGGDFPFRVIGSSITMTACLVGLSFVVGVYDEWSKRSEELRFSQMRLEAIHRDANQRVEIDLKEDLDYIRSELLRGLQVNSARKNTQLIETLQSIVVEVLKPKSSQLVNQSPLPSTQEQGLEKVRFSFNSLLLFLTLKKSSNPLWITVAMVVTFIPLVLRFEGLVVTVQIIGVAVALITPMLIAVNRRVSVSVDKLPATLRLPAIVGSLAFSVVPFAVLFPLLFPECSEIKLLPVQCLISVIFLGLTFGLGSAAGSEIERLQAQQLENNSKIRWNTARLFATHWFHKRQFARKLHGPMQAEILANVIRIEKSMEANEDANVFGEQSRVALQKKLMDLLSEQRRDMHPDVVLAELAETWDGICEIDVSFNQGLVEQLIDDQVACETVLEIIREATSNAIQHGGATKIRVCVAYKDSRCIILTISDDGSGLKGESQGKGLGSRYLEECTISYAFESAENYTTLTAQIPLSCSTESSLLLV